MGTKDISSGIMYIVTSRSGYANQILCKACDSNITPIKSITSSSPVNLVCLTSGPRGLFAIDLNSLSFGRLDDKTGEFKRMNYLPGNAISYTSVGAISHTSSVGVNAKFERRKKKKRTGGDNRRNIVDPYSNVGLVFAQDSHGVLHYIDKDGIHYKTKKKNEMKKTGIIFSSNLINNGDESSLPSRCGEFDGSDIIAVLSSSSNEEGEEANKSTILRYSFLRSTVTSQIL